MSRLPRISGKAALRAFEKSGFSVVRVRGSHHVMTNADGLTIVVPVHGSEVLGPGLLRSLLADANLNVDDFIALL